jgi:peptide/nickel transport system ATP-binding protein
MCDRVAVMKDGRMVELQDTESLFAAPQTDYTRSLLDLMPRLADLSLDGVESEIEDGGA